MTAIIDVTVKVVYTTAFQSDARSFGARPWDLYSGSGKHVNYIQKSSNIKNFGIFSYKSLSWRVERLTFQVWGRFSSPALP